MKLLLRLAGVVLPACCAMMMAGCGAKKDEASIRYGSDLLGGARYGGTLNLNDPSYPATLFPTDLEHEYRWHPAAQIFEGLFAMSQSGVPELCLAQSWQTDSSGLHVQITLKDSVLFHDSPLFMGGRGRQMLATDVSNALNKFFKAEGEPVVFEPTGLLTLKCTLHASDTLLPYLLTDVRAGIYPKELDSRRGEILLDAVGTGPFMIEAAEEDFFIDLKRNPNYHGKDAYGNRLPYLNGISIRYINDKDLEIKEFISGETDIFYNIPPKYVHEMETMRDERFPFSLKKVTRNTFYYLLLNPLHAVANVAAHTAPHRFTGSEVLVNKLLNDNGSVISDSVLFFWHKNAPVDSLTIKNESLNEIKTFMKVPEEDFDARHVAPYLSEHFLHTLGIQTTVALRHFDLLLSEQFSADMPAMLIFNIQSSADSASLTEELYLKLKQTGLSVFQSVPGMLQFLHQHPHILHPLWQKNEHIAVSSKVEGLYFLPGHPSCYARVYLKQPVVVQ